MKDLVARLLEEAHTHVVTVELSTGDSYYGTLYSSEASMNLKITDAVHTARSGKVSKLKEVMVRGSQVQMVILPEVLQYAPVLQPELLEQVFTAQKRKR